MKFTNRTYNSKVIEPSINSLELGAAMFRNIQKGGKVNVSNPSIVF